MNRVIAAIFLVLLWCGSSFAQEAAPHYLRPSCANNGNGTLPTCAETSGGNGAWKLASSANGHTYITGDDLATLGEIPGPLYGEVLRHVLAAKLDGTAPTHEQQLALASKYLAERHEGTLQAAVNLTEVLNGRT